jgi:hypothetical protein
VDPNVAGDGKVDLDLTRILAGVRSGGDLDRAGAVGEVSTRAREDASSRAAGLKRRIEESGAEFTAMSPLRLGEYEAQQRISNKYERGPATGPTPSEQYSRQEEAAAGLAQSLAGEGKRAAEIGPALIAEFPGIDGRALMGLAVDAERDVIKFRGNMTEQMRYGRPPAGPRIGLSGTVGGVLNRSGGPPAAGVSPARLAWDRAAEAARAKGLSPEEVLGPRP